LENDGTGKFFWPDGTEFDYNLNHLYNGRQTHFPIHGGRLNDDATRYPYGAMCQANFDGLPGY